MQVDVPGPDMDLQVAPLLLSIQTTLWRHDPHGA